MQICGLQTCFGRDGYVWLQLKIRRGEMGREEVDCEEYRRRARRSVLCSSMADTGDKEIEARA